MNTFLGKRISQFITDYARVTCDFGESNMMESAESREVLLGKCNQLMMCVRERIT